MQVGPHPHTGLSTVTWLLEGAANGATVRVVLRGSPGQLHIEGCLDGQPGRT